MANSSENVNYYKQLTEADVDDPLSREIVEHWQERCQGNFAPSWRQFSWENLNPKIIPYLTVVDVLHDPLGFVYRFWGTAHTNRKGIDLTGQSIEKYASPDMVAHTHEQYELLVEERKPLFFSDFIKFGLRPAPLVQTATRLPISDDGRSVSKAVSYCSFSGDHREWQMAFEETQNRM